MVELKKLLDKSPQEKRHKYGAKSREIVMQFKDIDEVTTKDIRKALKKLASLVL